MGTSETRIKERNSILIILYWRWGDPCMEQREKSENGEEIQTVFSQSGQYPTPHIILSRSLLHVNLHSPNYLSYYDDAINNQSLSWPSRYHSRARSRTSYHP